MSPRILVTFDEILWTGDDEYEEDRGWVDEEGTEIEADDLNVVSVVEAAVKFLKKHGATEPSSGGFHPGIWYSWPDAQQDFRTGWNRTESCHLKDFTPEQERAIYDEMKD